MFNRQGTDFVNGLVYPLINAAGGEDKFLRYEIGALSELADALVQFNLWNKFIAIYPFVGRNIITSSFNFKNPQQYRISWYGGLLFDKNGVTNNTNSSYGQTNIPLTFFQKNINNVHISAYNRTDIKDVIGDGRMIGVNTLEIERNVKDMGAFELNFGNNNGIIGYVYNKINDLGGFGLLRNEMISSGISGKGLMIGLNTNHCYLNGQTFGRWFPALPTEIHDTNNKTLLLFGNRFFTRVTSSANINLSFASVGYGLNKIDVYNYTNIVENFQKAMFRSAL
jgi:hypothetical protein